MSSKKASTTTVYPFNQIHTTLHYLFKCRSQHEMAMVMEVSAATYHKWGEEQEIPFGCVKRLIKNYNLTLDMIEHIYERYGKVEFLHMLGKNLPKPKAIDYTLINDSDVIKFCADTIKHELRKAHNCDPSKPRYRPTKEAGFNTLGIALNDVLRDTDVYETLPKSKPTTNTRTTMDSNTRMTQFLSWVDDTPWIYGDYYNVRPICDLLITETQLSKTSIAAQLISNTREKNSFIRAFAVKEHTLAKLLEMEEVEPFWDKITRIYTESSEDALIQQLKLRTLDYNTMCQVCKKAYNINEPTTKLAPFNNLVKFGNHLFQHARACNFFYEQNIEVLLEAMGMTTTEYLEASDENTTIIKPEVDIDYAAQKKALQKLAKEQWLTTNNKVACRALFILLGGQLSFTRNSIATKHGIRGGDYTELNIQYTIPYAIFEEAFLSDDMKHNFKDMLQIFEDESLMQETRKFLQLTDFKSLLKALDGDHTIKYESLPAKLQAVLPESKFKSSRSVGLVYEHIITRILKECDISIDEYLETTGTLLFGRETPTAMEHHQTIEKITYSDTPVPTASEPTTELTELFDEPTLIEETDCEVAEEVIPETATRVVIGYTNMDIKSVLYGDKTVIVRNDDLGPNEALAEVNDVFYIVDQTPLDQIKESQVTALFEASSLPYIVDVELRGDTWFEVGSVLPIPIIYIFQGVVTGTLTIQA